MARYLGYFVSFAFVGGVWIAHSNMTRFLKVPDPELMRLNLILLLFFSFLPFTTAIAATHLFASNLSLSNLSLHEVTVSSPTERVAAVLFGLNLTLAALMLYLMLRHAGRTSDVAADDLAEEELQAFATQRRSAVLLQASATVVGAFLPLLAVVFYLALALFYVIDPVRLMHTGSLRRAGLREESAVHEYDRGEFSAIVAENSPRSWSRRQGPGLASQGRPTLRGRTSLRSRDGVLGYWHEPIGRTCRHEAGHSFLAATGPGARGRAVTAGRSGYRLVPECSPTAARTQS